MTLKDILRKILIFCHLDITKNLQYDRLTKVIMRQCIRNNYNGVDIGCHKGEILDLMLKFSPEGKHYAFEPIPYLFEVLKKKYENIAQIFPYALSDTNGFSTFQLVKNAPAYSGIKRRHYDIENPEIEEIEVELKTLDEVVAPNEQIHFIKIDVEGGEFGVLKGAKKLLMKNKPTVLFECGKGACDYYGTDPLELYDFITNEIGLKIYTLKAFIKNKLPLTKVEFDTCFNTNSEYYFVAHT
jgi:FkbM family methyltransferase